MNSYITLDGKKYKTPAKLWQAVPMKPATFRYTLMGMADVTYGPGDYMEWQGQVEAPVTAQFDDGIHQIETAETLGAVTVGGIMTVTVTAAGLAGSPKTYSIPVIIGDDVGTWPLKAITVMNADPALTSLFTVTNDMYQANIILTARNTGPNDSTLNIAIAHGTSVGITNTPTSYNTSAGRATSSGTITDLRATLKKKSVVAFQDHYAQSTYQVHLLGPFPERSLTPKWDDPSNKLYIQVRIVKAV
jgi:hypothetical protein